MKWELTGLPNLLSFIPVAAKNPIYFFVKRMKQGPLRGTVGWPQGRPLIHLDTLNG